MGKLYFGSAVSVLAMALTACGGGGSGVASTPPPPAPPATAPIIPPPVTTATDENFDTEEYQSSTSAKFSNAMPAWQAGATGKGIKIGFVDSGIASRNPEFAGRIDPASRDFGGSGTIEDQYGHGTALASIAAAAHGNPGTQYLEGVAFESTIVVMKVAPAGCSTGCNYSPDDIAAGIKAAAEAGAKIINLSVGGAPLNSRETDAIKTAARNGVVFVVSAGNDSSAEPTSYAKGVVAAAPGQTIVAGALGRSALSGIDLVTGSGIDFNDLLDMSNRAGSLATSYLGAPGFVRVAYSDNLMDNVRGTSFAAPAVAGAAALLMQAFPNLSAEQVVQILLTTGDDLGPSGTDSTYGHGRLNIGRAFLPIGKTTLAGSQSPLSLTNNGSAPAAAGDAFQRGKLPAIALDSYGRAFDVDLALTLHSAPRARPLLGALASQSKHSFYSFGTVGVALGLAEEGTARRLGFGAKAVGPHGQEPGVVDFTITKNLGQGRALALSSSAGAQDLIHILIANGGQAELVNHDALSSVRLGTSHASAAGLRQDFGTMSFAIARETGSVRTAYTSDEKGQYRSWVVGLDKKVGPARAWLSISRLNEDSTLLGGRLASTFGARGSQSLFLDTQAMAELGARASLAVSARRGWSTYAGGTFRTSAYSLTLKRTGLLERNDALTLLMAQPLRFEGGDLAVPLPTTYSYETGTAATKMTKTGLRPSGREVDVELAYRRPVRFGSAGLNLYARRQPDHIAASSIDVGAAFRINLRL